MNGPLEAAARFLRSHDPASAERLLESTKPEARQAAEWHLLGAARHALGKRDAAIDAWRKALALQPDLTDAGCALATVLGETGAWPDAERVLRGSLALRPDHSQAHFNLACVLEVRGAGREALAQYDRVLALDPGHEGALLNRSALRMAFEEPAGALRDLEALLARHPRHLAAHVNRSRALLLLHRDEEALEAAQAAIALDPSRREAKLAAAIALASLARIDEASACMRDLDPAWDVHAAFVARAIDRQDVCHWQERDRLVQGLREVIASEARANAIGGAGLLHRALALPLGGDEILRIASAMAANVRAAAAPQAPTRSSRARIRVGVLSAGVALHPDYFLLHGLFEKLDRSRFEVVLIASNPDDGSQERRRLAAAADVFIDAAAMRPDEIVERARMSNLDLAVDTAGYFRSARPDVLKARIAPVQAAFMGIPGTYGPGIVDYRLSDPLATPPSSQSHWAEKLVLLPAPHYAYAYPGAVGRIGRREEHALPPQGFVFCCFNQCWKIEPEVFGVWMRLLHAVPGSVLWLVDEGERTRLNLQSAARERGVAPDRLVFAPRTPFADHLGRLQHADLFLDTFHYNAVTTAFDTLWAGVPVVTRQGATMASRLGASIVATAGLGDLVARSTEEYERLALRLATDPRHLERAKAIAGAARTAAPAFDLQARVRALEKGFAAMVERQRAGQAPALIEVP